MLLFEDNFHPVSKCTTRKRKPLTAWLDFDITIVCLLIGCEIKPQEKQAKEGRHETLGMHHRIGGKHNNKQRNSSALDLKTKELRGSQV